MSAPTGPTRLLDGAVSGGVVGLDAHLDRWGVLPTVGSRGLLEAVDQSGLRGHGGAWFPVGTKWRAVAQDGRRSKPVVVANGAEGEPASGKDRFLLHRSPHLVLDGAAVAATAIGSSQVVVHVTPDSVADVERALAERAARGMDGCSFEVVVAPDRFLAGQESAAVNTINGRIPGIPSFVGIRSVREQGVAGRPTLVQNVETLAHVALIARYGPTWFRGVGTHESPGTVLTTVTGLWDAPRIVEVPLGSTLGHALGIGPDRSAGFQAALLGGYGGGWVPTATALSMPYTEESARSHGTSIGAGVVGLLPTGVCPIVESARVVRYMAGEGAGQCGPCVNGLDVLATQLEHLAYRPRSLHGGLSALPTLCGLVEGRGACRHPDGVARFVRTAVDVFGDHAALHLSRGPCQTTRPFLPVPAAAVSVR
ncbi:MAG TPA: NADH-ubiquinone oxidoreductase-F iron-sulfur binding region domain-containing protein [Acidimicrobiales bacterium]